MEHFLGGPAVLRYSDLNPYELDLWGEGMALLFYVIDVEWATHQSDQGDE